MCHLSWYILKGPAGQTSRHWKAKAVAALANYLWKAPLERSPNQSPRGNSSPGTVGAPPKKNLLSPVTRKLNWMKGVFGWCWWLWGPEATVAWGKVQTRSDHGERGLPEGPPRPPPRTNEPPSSASSTRQLKGPKKANLASQEMIIGGDLRMKIMLIHRVEGCPWRL